MTTRQQPEKTLQLQTAKQRGCLREQLSNDSENGRTAATTDCQGCEDDRADTRRAN